MQSHTRECSADARENGGANECFAGERCGGGNEFDAGFQLGAKLEHQAAVRAVGRLVLEVLGKDRSDGVIDLGALKDPDAPDGLWLA